jgi:hypothetical protein
MWNEVTSLHIGSKLNASGSSYLLAPHESRNESHNGERYKAQSGYGPICLLDPGTAAIVVFGDFNVFAMITREIVAGVCMSKLDRAAVQVVRKINGKVIVCPRHKSEGEKAPADFRAGSRLAPCRDDSVDADGGEEQAGVRQFGHSFGGLSYRLDERTLFSPAISRLHPCGTCRCPLRGTQTNPS